MTVLPEELWPVMWSITCGPFYFSFFRSNCPAHSPLTGQRQSRSAEATCGSFLALWRGAERVIATLEKEITGGVE
jgi:hypothetical protein